MYAKMNKRSEYKEKRFSLMVTATILFRWEWYWQTPRCADWNGATEKKTLVSKAEDETSIKEDDR